MTDYASARATVADGLYAPFFSAMLERGVALAPGPYEAMFPGLAHLDAHLDAVVDGRRGGARPRWLTPTHSVAGLIARLHAHELAASQQASPTCSVSDGAGSPRRLPCDPWTGCRRHRRSPATRARRATRPPASRVALTGRCQPRSPNRPSAAPVGRDDADRRREKPTGARALSPRLARLLVVGAVVVGGVRHRACASWPVPTCGSTRR